MFGCLPEALDLIGKGLFNEVSASSDVSATTSSILGQRPTANGRVHVLVNRADADYATVLLG